MEKCIIAAVAEDGAIGKDNGLLWHLKEDLKYFKKVTMGCPVIMGRRTFESIGRPLPGRRNIVVSKTMQRTAQSGPVVVAGSLEEAYRIAGDAPRCFVIGGAQLYSEAVGTADRLYITAVHAGFPDADRFFPETDPGCWKLESSSGPQTDHASGVSFTFEVLVRKNG